MGRHKKELYPCAEEVRKGAYTKTSTADDEPDFIGNAPNYDKFTGWDVEKVLVFLNVD